MSAARGRLCLTCLATLSLAFVFAAPCPAQSGNRSIADRSIDWPTFADWRRVLSLRDYNTRVVVVGTCLLGLGTGVVGSYTLLRKRALTGDALSHATLPGIALAFIISTAYGGEGKSLPLLLAGAAVTGVLGVVAILLIRRGTQIKEDAALGTVLSVFFGAGVALLGIVQQMKGGHAAGLEGFIYGKTATMLARDAILIGTASLICLGITTALSKELRLLCFDQAYAASSGMSVWLLDTLLMAMVVAVTIIGLQAVGLVLVIALLVIPAAAARFWTEHLATMSVIAGVIGALSGAIGSAASALLPRLPSGAMIVMVATAFFLVSMVFGRSRGVMVRWWRRRQLNRRIVLDHLLRGVFEITESDHASPTPGVPSPSVMARFDSLLPLRSWSSRELARVIRHAEREGYVRWAADRDVRLTEEGVREAERLTRQHRLWELYLVTYADVATARVDRGADAIEHVLEPNTIDRLEELLRQRRHQQLPASPHEITRATESGGAS